jgi:microcin C transport system substrate-binding protein
MGIQNPAIDALVQEVIQAEDRQELITACRALDRALLWGFYVIPHWHIDYYRVAYWNKFSQPEINPPYDLALYTWWVDKEKKEALAAEEVK